MLRCRSQANDLEENDHGERTNSKRSRVAYDELSGTIL